MSGVNLFCHSAVFCWWHSFLLMYKNNYFTWHECWLLDRCGGLRGVFYTSLSVMMFWCFHVVVCVVALRSKYVSVGVRQKLCWRQLVAMYITWRSSDIGLDTYHVPTHDVMYLLRNGDDHNNVLVHLVRRGTADSTRHSFFMAYKSSRKYPSEPGAGYTNGGFKDHGIQPASSCQPEKDMMTHSFLRCVVAEDERLMFQLNSLCVRS